MKRILASNLVFLLALGAAVQAGMTARTTPAATTATTTATVAASPPSAAPEAIKAAPNDGVLDLYFIANRRSQIEPCGCQTKQRGGVQYEASLYNQHPGRPTVRVDAGDWTRMRIDLAPIESLKTRYLLRAMRAMELDAINVGLNDIQFNKAFFDNMAKDYPGALEALVSANIFERKNPERHAFAPQRVVERKLPDGRIVKIGITGVTTLSWSARPHVGKLEIGDWLVQDPLASLAPVVEALRPKVDLLIVLDATLNRKELEELPRRFPQIDVLVTTVFLPDPNALILSDGDVYLLHPRNALGKELGVVSLKPGDRQRWKAAGTAESLYVSLDLPIDPKLASLIKDFKAQTRELDANIPSSYQVQEIYAGVRSCLACHQPIYESWQKTRHAQALETLVNVGQQFNPECLKCHVTGFRRENGFYSVSHRPSMDVAGVQCEVCHGPARRHVNFQQQILAGVERWKTPAEYQEILKQAKLSIPPTKVEAATCISCHQGENDPHFVLEKYIHKVDHRDVPEKKREVSLKKPTAADAVKQH